jgi:APA family basic amino acid/polyamine antiporter
MSKLEGNLSLYGLTMVAIGACIGSGIFLSPSLVAGYLSSPLLILFVWGLGLLHALTGSLTFAELGAMMPKAGGQYAYLKEIFGPLVAFLYAWVTFVVINGSGIAALSLTFAKYTAFLVRLSPTGTLVLGAAAIAVMAAVNVVGTRFSDLAAKIFSGLKLGGLALIIGVGLFLGSPARTRGSAGRAPSAWPSSASISQSAAGSTPPTWPARRATRAAPCPGP